MNSSTASLHADLKTPVLVELAVKAHSEGRDEEAIAWLERAKRAPRYEPRHFPYVNLATVYARRHKVHEAIRELQHALAIEPRHVAARRELHRLIGLLN